MPAKSPDETRFFRDIGQSAREAIARFPIPARQLAIERLNSGAGRAITRTILRAFIPGM